MSHKIYTALIAVALAVGVYIGKSAFSVTKTVEVEKEVTKVDTQIVVREIVKPDGTKETVTTSTDKSVIKKDSTISATVAAPRPVWHVSVSASVKSPVDPVPVYALTVERNILGPFSVGVTANTERSVGIVIGYTF